MSKSNNNDNYDGLDELNEKIRTKSIPTNKDKEILLYRLNRLLTEDEHLYIFKEILQNLGKKIYSMTENGTLFDLNDLPNDAFWKTYYYSQLFIQDHEKQKELEKTQREYLILSDQFEEKMNAKLKNYINDDNQVGHENIEELSPYEKLRIKALSHCLYSTHSKTNQNNNSDLSLHNDKKMEKTIYSDTFKYKWKQENKLTQQKETNKETEFDNQSIETDLSDCGDYDMDDDDLMLNENYDNEQEKVELTRLKNQLLKLPKTKLTLKIPNIDYEDLDIDEYE